MRISTNGEYQNQGASNAYYSVVEFGDEFDLELIVRKDWTPAVYREVKNTDPIFVKAMQATGDTILHAKEIAEVTRMLQKGYRNSEYWESMEFLFMDVDNDVEKSAVCTIEEFFKLFADYEFYVITSRNHQKKKEGKDKGNKYEIPACDRFHVIFPLDEPLTDHADAKNALQNLINGNNFADRSVSDPTRYFYGFYHAKVWYNKGKQKIKPNVDTPRPAKRYVKGDALKWSDGSTKGQPADIQMALHEEEETFRILPPTHPSAVVSGDCELHVDEPANELPDYLKIVSTEKYSDFKADQLSKAFNQYTDQDRKDAIMKGLQSAAAIGAFDDYQDWIRLGMGLKMEGFTVDDWKSLSWPGVNENDMIHKHWPSFGDDCKVTGGTLLFYARQGNPNCLVKGVTRDDMKSALDSVISNVAIVKQEEKSGSLETLFTTLLDEPPVEREKQIKQILQGTYSTKGGLIRDSFTLDAIAKLDPDFHRLFFYDEAIGQIRYSERYQSIDEIDASIMHRCMCYGFDPGRDMRRDFIARWSLNHRFNSMEQLVYNLMEKDKGQGEKAFEKFCSYIVYKSEDGDCPEMNRETIAMYTEAWRIFFMKVAMRMHSAYMKDKVPNDYIIALTGGEGKGKSFFCRWIALSDDFFFDYGDKGDIPLGSPDSIRMIRGKLIVELGEGSFMKKTDDLSFKSFVSQKTDTFIDKFKTGATTIPRTASMMITSNIEKFLKGLHGNRRVTPLPIFQFDFSYSEDKETMPQLYAHFLKLAKDVMIRGRAVDVRENEKVKKFFDNIRTSSINMSYHEEYIQEAIRAIEADQLLEINSQKNIAGQGRPRENIVFSAKMVIDKLLTAKIQVTNEITERIGVVAVSMGYTKGKTIRINGMAKNGYKLEIRHEFEQANPHLMSRHDHDMVNAILRPY